MVSWYGWRNNFCNPLPKKRTQFRKSARKNATPPPHRIGCGAKRRGQFCAPPMSRFCGRICEIACDLSAEGCNHYSANRIFQGINKFMTDSSPRHYMSSRPSINTRGSCVRTARSQASKISHAPRRSVGEAYLLHALVRTLFVSKLGNVESGKVLRLDCPVLVNQTAQLCAFLGVSWRDAISKPEQERERAPFVFLKRTSTVPGHAKISKN